MQMSNKNESTQLLHLVAQPQYKIIRTPAHKLCGGFWLEDISYNVPSHGHKSFTAGKRGLLKMA
ncbi:hypothetical protein PBN151_2196 [Paenibacillus sp. NAIST15-1]|nr:hypothetical protein PBN151_2196 [Paenibacillus sp. NAIST15-1]